MASGPVITLPGGTAMTQVIIGDIIEVDDFNNARTNVDTLLGIPQSPNLGSLITNLTFGYGQGGAGVAPAQIGEEILANGVSGAFNELQDDVQALQAFTGTNSHTIVDVTSGQEITASDWNTLMLAVKDIWNNRFVALSTTTSTDDSTVRTANWQNTLTCIMTYTFANSSACKGFFNLGGGLGFSGSITGGTNINTADFANILSSVGDVILDYSSTSASGGTNYGLGFYELTSTYQTVLTKTGAGAYTGNQLTIQAKVDSTSAPKNIYIKTFLVDSSDGVVDDPITGTLTLNARTKKPASNGSGFNIPEIINSGSTSGQIL